VIRPDQLDPDTVARIIGVQFPHVRPRSVRWLGEGYDSTAFEVDGAWVFRFPKRREVEDQLLLEMRLLPVLAPAAPLAVPMFRFEGVPSDQFPRHFCGYAKIPGTPAIGLDPLVGPIDGLAGALGRFLSWLHGLDRAEAAGLGVPEARLSSLIAERMDDALADFERVRHVAPDGPLEEWRAYIEAGPPASASRSEPVVVHGDFAAEHVLYDPAARSVTGVIDWSEVAICDADVDLAGLLHWGGRRLVEATLPYYDHPVDESVLDRARYLAACRGVADIAFGLDTDRPEYIRAGLRALYHCNVPFLPPVTDRP
jgi:aminoglycoside phosphotransferase (APT) family kinase protein